MGVLKFEHLYIEGVGNGVFTVQPSGKSRSFFVDSSTICLIPNNQVRHGNQTSLITHCVLVS